MTLHQPQCIWKLDAELAEGPVWIADEAALYFVDIKGKRIHRCAEDGSQARSWQLEQQVGFALPLKGDDFICGLPGKLMRFSPLSGSVTLLHELEQNLPGNRLNDAFVDHQGSLWFGSMDDGEKAASGCLYRLNAEGILQHKDSDYVITNGPAMSPCGQIFYHTDTLQKKIYAFDVASDGALSGKRLFKAMTGVGHPDGTTVDALGYLWIAIFGGARIERYSPSGQLVETIHFPCSNITKVAFGGADLCTAFVTTAWKNLSPEARQQQALAGGIFSFRTDVPGQKQYQFSNGNA